MCRFADSNDANYFLVESAIKDILSVDADAHDFGSHQVPQPEEAKIPEHISSSPSRASSFTLIERTHTSKSTTALDSIPDDKPDKSVSEVSVSLIP
jgi:hypothetical protein